jgi:cytochrome c oxidase subunit IV
MRATRSVTRIFRWPLLVALLTFAGLLSALVGDDEWDAMSWALLSVPVALCVVFSLMRKERTGR